MSKSKAAAPVELPDAQEKAQFDAIMEDFNSGNKMEKMDMKDLPPPFFTLKELRDCIPKHCFERDNLTSLSYVLRDLVAVSVIGFIAWQLASVMPFWMRVFVLWPVYAFVQGAVMTGLWVLAHECGHRAFSASKTVNDTVGWILHSALLVPYHSWRITHGNHHKNTARMSRDQVFVPVTMSQVRLARTAAAMEDSPLVSLVGVVTMLTVGWPGYLMFNVTGQNYGRRTNHFEPSSPIFKKEHWWNVIQSDVGLFIVIGLLFLWAQATSFSTVFVYYLLPYLWVNAWLVGITFLQHTHADIPHYRDGKWNFVRGALATIDRDVGLFNILHHHIADTHVAHHLFSQMPHYHAQEATEALKKKLGPYYRRTNENFAVALYNVWRSCEFVDDDGQVLYFKTRKDLHRN